MNIKEMKARLRAIDAEAATVPEGETERLDALLAEARDLSAKIEEANARRELKGYADGAAEEDPAGKTGESGFDPKDAATNRGKALMAGKKVRIKNALTSSQTVLTQHTASDVNPTFNDISSLIDRVKLVQLPGGESYKRGFVKSYGAEGDYTAEGAAYSETEPTFGYATMTKSKITAYCEEPEEIQKLAAADYDAVIGSSSERAVRKKITRQILAGDGSAGKLCGIFHNPTSEADDIIDRKTDLSIAEIDENTLDEIIYAYGGDEDVEDAAVLILNKADVKKFATLRLADGKKAYTVVNHGNAGTIDGIPYIINSACAAISADGTADGTYCMAYGSLSNYELAVFSDMDVQRSTEYKFKEGQIAHRADIFVGGNVAAYNGFVRVKKKKG